MSTRRAARTLWGRKRAPYAIRLAMPTSATLLRPIANGRGPSEPAGLASATGFLSSLLALEVGSLTESQQRSSSKSRRNVAPD